MSGRWQMWMVVPGLMALLMGCEQVDSDTPAPGPDAGPVGDAAVGELPDPECPEGRDLCGRCGGAGPATWYADLDGDGRGDDAVTVQACAQPDRFVGFGGDTEPECVTNNTDDCGVCGGRGRQTWYADGDGDGRGDPAVSETGCVQPGGFVDNEDDIDPRCASDDSDACGVCGGPGEVEWFEDVDGDGLGDGESMTVGCEAPVAFVGNRADPEPACATNDTDECGVCGGPGAVAWYFDADGDGQGDPDTGLLLCEAPGDGFVQNRGDREPDCASDDTDACGVCAGPGPGVWFADVDGDGLGDARARVEACEGPAGFVGNDRDREPECATNDSGRCGGCGGGGRVDCSGMCDGTASRDRCGICSGGGTGVVPTPADGTCPACDREGLGRLIVQFTDVPRFDDPAAGPYTFQVVLYEGGDFAFLYRDVEPFVESATVGYQGGAGAGAVQLGFEDAYPVEHGIVSVRRQPDGSLAVEKGDAIEWLDIREVGDALILEDDTSLEVALGFEFAFDARSFDAVRVSSNGVVSFDGRFNEFNNSRLPNAELGAFLAPLWDDLNPAAGGRVTMWTGAVSCAVDCDGTPGGFAVVDGCGVCAGGSTGVAPDAGVDCAGVCGGTAAIDACGQCAGGDTGREPLPAEACPQGPDLVVDRPYLRDTLAIEYLDVRDECLLDERCVRGLGRRKIIRFGTRIGNVGTADLQLGRPSDDNPAWTYDECHEHFHFDAYAAYDLYDVAADAVLPIGAKTGFSVIDIGVYDPAIAVDGCRGYNGNNQGITAGCHDTYGRGLQCQWIDITDVPDGEYDVVVTTNPLGEIAELSLENNSARVRVQIRGDDLEIAP